MAAAVATEADLAVEAAASTAAVVAVAVSTAARTIIHIIPIHPFGAVGIPVGATMAVAVA